MVTGAFFPRNLAKSKSPNLGPVLKDVTFKQKSVYIDDEQKKKEHTLKQRNILTALEGVFFHQPPPLVE